MKKNFHHQYLTAREVQSMLKLGKNRVYSMLNDGTMPGYRIDGSWRIEADELQGWLDSRRNRPSKEAS